MRQKDWQISGHTDGHSPKISCTSGPGVRYEADIISGTNILSNLYRFNYLLIFYRNFIIYI